jgi:hypothetical protein
VGTGQSSLAGRAYGLILRRVKTARKQSKRGVKLAQNVFRRVRQAEKSLFFRLRDSETGRKLLKAAGLAGSQRDIRHRAQAAAPYVARLDNHRAIDPAKGYALLSPDALGGFSDVLASCRQLFAAKKAEIDAQLTDFERWTPEQQQKFMTRKQSFLRYLLDDDDLRRHPELVNFALNDAMLGAATRYLGMVPYLTRIDLMYSLPRSGGGKNIESQLFHLDHEGLTQIKHFIHLFDVGEHEGPFTFIPADATARIVRDVRTLRKRQKSGQNIELRRYSDEEIAAVGGTEDIVTVTGPVGSGVAVDTSRCLHLGSRVDPGSFRLCLYTQYCTTHEITNVYDVDRFKDDPVKFLAVKDSVIPGRPRATAYYDEITN